MSLVDDTTVGARCSWLGRLVEGFKVEDVEAPIESRTDAGLEEGLGVVRAGDGGRVVGSTCVILRQHKPMNDRGDQ